VRLEMYNPNFDLPVDELQSPELATMQTIVSDWSEPTPEATVPMRYRYYVTKVDGRHGRRKQVDLPTYYENDGSLPVMDKLDVEMGMPIGGKRKQRRVDLEKTALETGEVEYNTNDILCAAEQMPRLTPDEHPDLGNELKALGRRRQPAGDLVCVLDQNGNLVLRRVGDDADGLRTDKMTIDFIMEEYEDWKAKTDELSGLMAGYDGDLSDLDVLGMDMGELSELSGMFNLGVGNALGNFGGGNTGDRPRRRSR